MVAEPLGKLSLWDRKLDSTDLAAHSKANSYYKPHKIIWILDSSELQPLKDTVSNMDHISTVAFSAWKFPESNLVP